MNTNLAHDIVGLVTDDNDRFYFVQKDGQTYALDKAEGEHALGESVKGFAYTDMKQRLRLTTLEVTARQDQFGWGTVTEVRKDLGVFVDTGLPDKEIVVSLDILQKSRICGRKKVINSLFVWKSIKKTGSGVSWLTKKTSNGLPVQPTITCRTKTGRLSSIA